jgi:hypothetical protein
MWPAVWVEIDMSRTHRLSKQGWRSISISLLNVFCVRSDDQLTSDDYHVLLI